MKFKYADLNIKLTVRFQDDGTMDLNDQAIEYAKEDWHMLDPDEIEVVGEVRDTEFPPQKGKRK